MVNKYLWGKVCSNLTDGKDDHGNIVCKSLDDNWEIITPSDFRFCDGFPDCKSDSDELCPYVTIRDNLKSARITRKLY